MWPGIRATIVASIFGMVFLGASERAALAQHGGMHGSMPMQPDASMDPDQMLKKVDAKLNAATATMSDLAAQHAAMESSPMGDQLVESLQGMLAQMRQFRGALADMARDPGRMQQPEAMKAVDQTCRDFEQMAGAFQSMAKSVGRIMGGAKAAR